MKPFLLRYRSSHPLDRADATRVEEAGDDARRPLHRANDGSRASAHIKLCYDPSRAGLSASAHHVDQKTLRR